MKSETAKNERSKDIAIHVIIGLIGAAALACIIISMAADKASPYLAMGLGLSFIGNALGTLAVRRKKGNKDGSYKDGRIS